MHDPTQTANLLAGLSPPGRTTLARLLRVAPAKGSALEHLCREPSPHVVEQGRTAVLRSNGTAGVVPPDTSPEAAEAAAAFRAASPVAERLGHLLAPLSLDQRASVADILEQHTADAADLRIRIERALDAFARGGRS